MKVSVVEENRNKYLAAGDEVSINSFIEGLSKKAIAILRQMLSLLSIAFFT
jgi:hypothetical protein